MAQRVDLEKSYTQRAIDGVIQSLKRSAVKEANPLIKELIEKDIAIYTKARDTLTDVK